METELNVILVAIREIKSKGVTREKLLAILNELHYLMRDNVDYDSGILIKKCFDQLNKKTN